MSIRTLLGYFFLLNYYNLDSLFDSVLVFLAVILAFAFSKINNFLLDFYFDNKVETATDSVEE